MYSGYLEKNLHYYVLRDLLPFVQFKKRQKTPMEDCYFYYYSKTSPWVFFTFFELYKWCQIAQRIIYTLS